MDTLAFLKSKEVALPVVPSKDSFIKRLAAAMADYDALLANVVGQPNDAVVDAILAERPLIQTTSGHIVAAASAYLSGAPDQAYKEVATALTGLQQHLSTLSGVIWEGQKTGLFRCRAADSPTALKKSDLYHIPFELRHLVATQRFSIPGVPSLYLGGSTFACWVELGRPPLDRLAASCWRVAPEVQLRILDLGYTPQHLLHLAVPTPHTAQSQKFIVSWGVLWPLAAACMMRVAHPRGAFKAEYTIPQLVLRWVADNGAWHGVRYFSTHLPPETPPAIGTNWVFPVETQPLTGHCQSLLAKFECSDALSWTAMNAAGMPMQGPHHGGEIQIQDDVPVDYTGTQFWKMEATLRTLF